MESSRPHPCLTVNVRVTANADVLEVIAEYTCGTVRDACALRGSCKGYRRAVDTTVRRLVYEDQPKLRDGDSFETLELCRGRVIDTVFAAFFRENLRQIFGIVVVAFALDGAKDELHEGDACGERPVATRDFMPLFRGSDAATGGALRRCMTHVCVQNQADVFSAEHVAAPEALAAVWPRLTVLRWFDAPDVFAYGYQDCVTESQTEGLRQLCRVLRGVGPQLRTLDIKIGITSDAQLVDELCPAVARCANLNTFRLNNLASAVSAPLCDALLASGAPLEENGAPLAYEDAMRLMEARIKAGGQLVCVTARKRGAPAITFPLGN